MADDDLACSSSSRLARQLNGLPWHLSQHVGGFVLTQAPERLVPIENATMDNRSVIEWDKDDIDELKMMKVDVGPRHAHRDPEVLRPRQPTSGTAIDPHHPDNDTATTT